MDTNKPKRIAAWDFYFCGGRQMPGAYKRPGIPVINREAATFLPSIVTKSRKSDKTKNVWDFPIGAWVQVPCLMGLGPIEDGSRPMTLEQCTQQGAWV